MDFMDDAFFDKIFYFGFGTVGIMLIIGILSFGAIFIAMIKGFKRNNASPRLTVMARVISKRTDITSRGHISTTDNNINTWYYVTFQFDSGDRMEFCVAEYEYGLLIEGDIGQLTFQGTSYISFERR